MENGLSVEFISKHLSDWMQHLKKYKYAVLILLLGIVLMAIPQGKREQSAQTTSDTDYEDIEIQLEEILGKVEGAGAVKVMLTQKEGMQYTYLTNDQYQTYETERERKETAVLLSDGNGAETVVVSGTKYPVFKGAVIVCEGADSPLVKYNIVNAVSDLTGLSSDRISVIKMKRD